MKHMSHMFVEQKKIIILLFIIFSIPSIFVCAEEEDFSASGYNKQRIEQEDKLLVPIDKVDEVWAFLKDRYVDDKEYLQKIDSLFTSYWNLEEFWDTYYDTPSLQLLNMKSGVRHRRRINHTDPDDKKSGRELMQIKLSNISSNPLDRGEIKFKIEYPGEIKDPNKYSMLAIVNSSQQEDFKQRLTQLGLDPYSMKPILTVHDMRSRIYIKRNGNPFMSISLDRADSQLWWAKISFVEIEPELNEIAYTDADKETQKYMEDVLGKIMNEIRVKFPYIERDLTPKYNKSFNKLEGRLPYLKLLVKANMHNTDGMAIVFLSVIGIICLLGYISIKKFRTIKFRYNNK